METVGVIIATYNGEKYVEEQLRSICKQTRKPDFVLVTDGGSNDLTVVKCAAITKEFPGIAWKIMTSDARLGVKENFLRGIKNITGDYIFFADQDDIWYPNKIERMLEKFHSDSRYSVVISDADIVDATARKTGITQWQSIGFTHRSISNNDVLVSEMFRRNICTGMCMAYRNGAFNYESIASDNMLHDEAIGWFGVLKGRLGVLDEQLAAYRQHGENAVGSKRRSPFKSLGNMKDKVKTSSNRTRNKYVDLEKKYHATKYEGAFLEAIEFYETRCEIFDGNKGKVLKNMFSCVLRGRYRRFTSKTEKALLKDIICILL